MSASLQESLDFSTLEPTEIPFGYAHRSYVLREASEGAAVKWRTAVVKALDATGTPKEGFFDTSALLVSLCLFSKDDAGAMKPVKESDVKALPSKVVKKLFQVAKDISDLEEKPTTAEELREKIAELQKQLTDLEAKEASADTRPTSDDV